MIATVKALERLQAATSRRELAQLLKIKISDLTYLLYVKKEAQKYKTFEIPKKNGGHRVINAPTQELKSLQRRLAQHLQQCLADIQQDTKDFNDACHGFSIGKSILTNASFHRNKRYVFNIDLKDFFPSINGARVRGLLIKDRNFKISPIVATTIAHIACREGVLPQGSPCSPVLSNLVAGILDIHLSRLAKQCGCRYTRYADDITFSTNKREFPQAIARQSANDANKWEVAPALFRLIEKSGFSINEAKTRMQYWSSRQEVTGLVVNKKINVPAEYRRMVRAYVFSLITHGKYEIRTSRKDKDGNMIEEAVEGTTAQLHGMLGFVHSVDNVLRADQRKHPYNYPGVPLETKKATGNLAIYRRFLLYTRFYANDQPLVICEGKTDNVYIGNAAHQLKQLFPELIKSDPKNGKDVLSFRFLKYARQHRKKHYVYLPNFSAVSILGGGSGGGANLAGLIRSYHNNIGKFKAPRGSHPVIFVVDNDSGGNAVFKTIKDVLKIDVDKENSFTRIFANVYIVPISLPGKKEATIEDLFDNADISQGLNGKPFDFSKDADFTTTFGKDAFAYQFVAKRASSLNWSGFHRLLRSICDAIADYKLVIIDDKI